MEQKLNKSQIIQELWYRGNLKWKLHDIQKQMYELFYGTDHKTLVWLLSRRSGKSYALVALAIEECLKGPGRIVKFLSPTQKQVETNLRPIFQKLLEDCPSELRPSFSSKQTIWHFPNGSEIQLAGTDKGNGDKLRGGDAHLCIIDEAGMCNDLKYMIQSILKPSMLITRGKLILATTPPVDSDHEFLHYYEEAERKGTLTKKTIYDNPMLTDEILKECIEEAGGIHTEEFRREFLCEIIKNSDNSVIPEFTEELKAEIVKEWPTPPYFDTYVSMDVGFKDLTVILFGYFDFRANKLVIQDEIVKEGKDLHLPELAAEIARMEEKLWTNPYSGEVKRPTARVSDIDYIVISELNKHSQGKVSFTTASKDNKDAVINNLRVMLLQKRIIIHPRCKTLISHLMHVRRKSRDSNLFARSTDHGHYDAVDAICYMIKHVLYSKNPYPATYGYDTQDLFVANKEAFHGNSQLEAYKKIFNVKKR